jgi:gamma-glutamyltranspeptidase/glutathione hydrolase
MAVFRKGGNAIDAAIAAAVALGVVDPASTGPGGDLFAIVYSGGKLHGLNASGHSAEKMTLEELQNRCPDGIPGMGFLSVTVSGGPAGWAALS